MFVGHLTAILILLNGGVQNEKLPKPPYKYEPPTICFARSQEENGVAKIRLYFAMPDEQQYEFTDGGSAYPKFRWEERERNGQKEKVMIHISTPPHWVEDALAVDGKQASIFDVEGKPVDAKTWASRLREPTPVLVAIGEKPDPLFLQTTKNDTLVIVVHWNQISPQSWARRLSWAVDSKVYNAAPKKD